MKMKALEIFVLVLSLAGALGQPAANKANQLEIKSAKQVGTLAGLQQSTTAITGPRAHTQQYQANIVENGHNRNNQFQHYQLQNAPLHNQEQSPLINQQNQVSGPDIIQSIHNQDLSQQFQNSNQDFLNQNQAVHSYNQMQHNQQLQSQIRNPLVEELNQAGVQQSYNQMQHPQQFHNQIDPTLIDDQNRAVPSYSQKTHPLQMDNQIHYSQQFSNQMQHPPQQLRNQIQHSQQLSNQFQHRQQLHKQRQHPQQLHNQIQTTVADELNQVPQYIPENQVRQFHSQNKVQRPKKITLPEVTVHREIQSLDSNFMRTSQETFPSTISTMQPEQQYRGFSAQQPFYSSGLDNQRNFHQEKASIDQASGRMYTGLPKQQSSISSGIRSTSVKVSAFEKRVQPISFPRTSQKHSATVLVSGLKNLPSLPALVYSAGSLQIPAGPHILAYPRPWSKDGAYVSQHWQTPHARYVYSHIL